MPITIEGKIEYLDLAFSIDESIWQTWMNIPSIIRFNDEINWMILGNPRDFKNTKEKHIAKERGFPENPSFDLMRDIEDWTLSECKNDEFGFTNFLYSEIKHIDWGIIVHKNESDWCKLFILIEKFMELKNLSAERIRITAWYSW
jgi:hypothetical protein